MPHLFGFGHGEGHGGLEWDEILIALLSIFTWFRSGKPHETSEGEGKGPETKVVSALRALVSRVDEGMWLSLFTKLTGKQKRAVTRLLEFLNRFGERDSFRLTVVNAPIATVVIEVPDPKDKKKKTKKVVKVGEYTDEDTRVIFLRDIAVLVDDPAWGPKAVRDMLRTHNLATENKVGKRALELWKGFLSWARRTVCDFFEVDSLDEITTDMVAGRLNVIADRIPDRSDAELNTGFWVWAWKRHPWKTVFLVSLTITAIALLTMAQPIKGG